MDKQNGGKVSVIIQNSSLVCRETRKRKGRREEGRREREQRGWGESGRREGGVREGENGGPLLFYSKLYFCLIDREGGGRNRLIENKREK